MMTSAQVVETSVNVTSNSPSQDYTHPDDHNLPNYSTVYVTSNRMRRNTRQFRWIKILSAILRYQGTPNDNIAFSPFERQAFHKDPDKLYIF